MDSPDISPELLEAAQVRAAALGYASVEDYLGSLLRRDIAAEPDHEVPLIWSRMSEEDQAKLDAKILDWTKISAGLGRDTADGGRSLPSADG
jgi:hypothetical protein